MKSANKLTLAIILFMLVGIVVGGLIHEYTSQHFIDQWSSNITLLSDLFLRLIKMVIAPLVFSTLTVGIMKLGNVSTVGKVGIQSLFLFIASSAISILIGLLVVTVQEPGVGMNLVATQDDIDTGLAVSGMTFKGFLSHMVPTSIVDAMARNDILSIAVFAMFFGIAGAGLGNKMTETLVSGLNAVSNIMLRITGYVMYVAPLAIFAAVSSAVAKQGLGVLVSYATFIGGFYVAIGLTAVVLMVGCYSVLKKDLFRLLSMMKDPILLAFTTTSSEAAYPKTLEQLVKFGCPRNITSFILPIDYSFNLVGSMVYCSFASMFIAQAYNVEMSVGETFALMATLMFASKGVAGVPRSALVVLAATIPSFNIPVSGILILMGIDHFLDMGRSAINVLMCGTTTAVLTKDCEADKK